MCGVTMAVSVERKAAPGSGSVSRNRERRRVKCKPRSPVVLSRMK